MSKYKAKKVNWNGEVFDSKKEWRRYLELQMLERAGKIRLLKRQVPFLLIPAQHETYERYSEKTGKRLKDGKRCLERELVYVADFTYFDAETGEYIVEDTKGVRTEAYIVKRKLLLHTLGIKIKET